MESDYVDTSNRHETVGLYPEDADEESGTVSCSLWLSDNYTNVTVRVRACLDDEWGPWSDAVAITPIYYGTVDAPVITLSATEVAMGDEVTVTWSAVEHAASYTVTFNSTVYETENTSYTVTAGTPGTYTVHVCAIGDRGYSASE